MTNIRDFFSKCKCGEPANYSRMVAGQFFFTCTKYGCAKDGPVRLSGGTGLPLTTQQWLAKHGRDFIGG